MLGVDQTPRFQNYHRVLNRAVWPARQGARLLLGLLVETFAPAGPPVFGLDETIERRWGQQITARGIYRDAALFQQIGDQQDERPALGERAVAGPGQAGPNGSGLSHF